MEWVETTGKTVEEAKEAALDQLGVDEQEAEFEIIEEPKSGLFGRVRREARVRARVQPKKPRPKADRRERRRKGPKDGDRRNGGGAKTGGGGRAASTRSEKGGSEKGGRTEAKNGGSQSAGNKPENKPDNKPDNKPGNKTRKPENTAGAKGGNATAAVDPEMAGAERAAATPEADLGDAPRREAVQAPGNERSRDRGERSRNGEQRAEGEQVSSETVSMDEQASIIEEFLDGLMDAFGVQTEIRREDVDDELLEVQVDAPDLGLLIGPKGQTLGAIQELSRTVLQRKATGVYDGRVRIDIGGYRNRRRAALERFATGVAEQVRASGTQKVLEPMNPADRKVVHDTINDLDGVSTSSEGTEPYRRVVIRPAE